MNEAFIALGSNIDPENNILLALEFLNQNFTILDISSTWQTKAVGGKANDYLNTAVKLQTERDADSLKMGCLRHIEETMGRIREKNKNAPRTIDLDIIIFNGTILDEKLFSMDHLILPFAELAPDLVSPKDGIPLKLLAEKVMMKTQAKPFKCLIPGFGRQDLPQPCQ